MSVSDNNLLTLLHRWWPRQDENFMTEAFAHLLRHLLLYEAVRCRRWRITWLASRC